jgi:hypothetical protein
MRHAMKTSLEHLPEIKLFERAYVDARYDPNFTITREELAAIAIHVRELGSRVEMVCRERIEAMAVEMPG